jgi:hypothetical protein
VGRPHCSESESDATQLAITGEGMGNSPTEVRTYINVEAGKGGRQSNTIVSVWKNWPSCFSRLDAWLYVPVFMPISPDHNAANLNRLAPPTPSSDEMHGVRACPSNDSSLLRCDFAWPFTYAQHFAY